MDLGLSNRTALICGGGRGIGKACALVLAREGAQVGVLSRTQAELDQTVAEITAQGGQGLALRADLQSSQEVDAAIQTLEQKFGAPTLLVLGAAALWQPRKLHIATDEESRAYLETDLFSALSLCRKTIPGMLKQKHGRIVALSSLAASTGIPGGTEYTVAKAGLEGLMRGLALDYARKGITANALSLGFVQTERLTGRTEAGAEMKEKLIQATSRKALIQPEEVANAVLFLLSEKSSAITGATLQVTAGAHLNNLW